MDPIKIDLDKSPAKAAAEAFRADMRALNAGLATDTKAALAQELGDIRRAVEGKKRYKTAAAEEEIRRARQDSQIQQGLSADMERALKRVGDAAEDTGKKGEKGFSLMSGGASAAVVGLGAAVILAKQLAAEFDRVGAKSRELSDRFATDRDKLRELAAVEGRQADSGFTLETHRFARDAAMTFEEAVPFRANFANVAQQFKGRNINDEEYEQYMALTAANTARTGAGSEAGANFGGAFLTRDLKKFGKGAAEEAFREQYKIGAIYDAGEGSPTQNFGGFAALKKEYEPGAGQPFKTNEELATVGSLANAAGPDRQREQVSALIRDLRDGKNKKLKAVYKQAGVTGDMSVQETIEKIAPVLLDQAKTEGKGLDQVLQGIIALRESREALLIQIQQGVVGGGYAQRAGVAAKAGAGGIGEKALEDFRGSEAGIQRTAEADFKLAEAERAAKNSDLTTLRRQSLARLIREQRIDTNATGVTDFGMKNASFGLIGNAEAKRIDDEVQRTLKASVGGDLDTFSFNITPEAREKELRAQIAEVRRRGVNPMDRSGGDPFLDRDERGPLHKFGEEVFGLVNDYTQEKVHPQNDRSRDRGVVAPNNPSVGGMRDPQMDEQTKAIREMSQKIAPPVPKPLIANPVMQRR